MKSMACQDIEVRVRVTVNRLQEVCLVDQTFTANLQLEASWVDPDHKPELEGRKPDRKPVAHPIGRWDSDGPTEALQRRGILRLITADDKVEHLFAPRLKFNNSIEEKDSEMWYVFYEARHPKSGDPQLITCLRWAVTIKFQAKYKLKKFPIDHQHLEMELRSNYEHVSLVENRNPEYRSFANINNFALSDSYQLDEDVRFDAGLTDANESAQQARYSRLKVCLVIERKTWYWILNVFIPMLVIVFSSFASFFVPRTDLADRSAITVTLLLALVAFKLVIADKLPHLSYATIVDWYVMACFVLLSVIILWQAFASVGIFPEEVICTVTNVTDAAGVTKPVEVSWAGIAGGATWLLANACGLGYIKFRPRHVHGPKPDHNRALYVNERNFHHDIRDDVFQRGGAREIITRICEEHHIAKPVDIQVWTPETVVAAFDEKDRKLPYRMKHSFVLVVFKDETDRDNALNEFGGKLGAKLRMHGSSQPGTMQNLLANLYAGAPASSEPAKSTAKTRKGSLVTGSFDRSSQPQSPADKAPPPSYDSDPSHARPHVDGQFDWLR